MKCVFCGNEILAGEKCVTAVNQEGRIPLHNRQQNDCFERYLRAKMIELHGVPHSDEKRLYTIRSSL